MAKRKYDISEFDNTIQEFTVQFHGGLVRIDGSDLPVGQISTEVLNLPDEKLRALDDTSEVFSKFLTGPLVHPATRKDGLFIKQLQEKANAVQEVIFTIPPYSHMQLDTKLATTAFLQWYKENPKELLSGFQKNTLAHTVLGNFFESILYTFQDVMEFRSKVGIMLDIFFEPLPKRNPSQYAKAMNEFLEGGALLDDLDENMRGMSVFKLQQTRTAMVDYEPMQESEDSFTIAERMVFHRTAEFLHMDLFRALIAGNAPRRCHNCGTFFLLTNGYNTCYCNNIAPGETERTCRKVGAHKKAAVEKGKSPIRAEYDRVYRRLTTRKNRGRISADEWNAAVVKAQEYKDRAEKGEINELELKEVYDAM